MEGSKVSEGRDDGSREGREVSEEGEMVVVGRGVR